MARPVKSLSEIAYRHGLSKEVLAIAANRQALLQTVDRGAEAPFIGVGQPQVIECG